MLGFPHLCNGMLPKFTDLQQLLQITTARRQICCREGNSCQTSYPKKNIRWFLEMPALTNQDWKICFPCSLSSFRILWIFRTSVRCLLDVFMLILQHKNFISTIGFSFFLLSARSICDLELNLTPNVFSYLLQNTFLKNVLKSEISMSTW